VRKFLKIKRRKGRWKMSTWIFQGNPDIFAVNEYLANSKNRIISWSVRQKNYVEKILPGDEVFIWRADGRRRFSGGIVAKGIVISRPTVMEEGEEVIKLWKKYPGKEYRVKIFLEEVRLFTNDGMIPRIEIEEDDILKHLKIVNFRQHTNYLVESEFVNRLRLMWALKKIGHF